jgi:hypothetical protein
MMTIWQKYLTLFILGLAFVFPFGNSAQSMPTANTWYVASTGNDNAACNTPSVPCATIQKAVTKAAAGDTINIATGVYTGTGNVVIALNKSLTLNGGWNVGFMARTGLTTFDGEGARRVFTVNADFTVTLRHVIVQHGFALDAGGVNNHGALSIEDSAIQDNSSSTLGGDLSHGGGIYSFGDITLTRVSLVRNSVYGWGGGLYNAANATIINSTFSENYAIWGAAIESDGDTTLLNSDTIYHNHTQNGGALNIVFGSVTMQHTILTENATIDCMAMAGSAGPISQGYNFIGTTEWCNFAPQPTDHIGVDVQLNSHLIGLPGYYALQPTSPAVNAAPPTTCVDATGAPLTVDQRGLTRDSACDSGAYEYIPPGPIARVEIVGGAVQHTRPNTAFPEPFQLFTLDEQGTPATGTAVYFTAPASGASGLFSSTHSYTATVNVDGLGIATAPAFIANAITGVYAVIATTENSGPTSTFLVGNTSALYVATTGNDTHLCWTPAAPCASVNAAIKLATSGDMVYVTTGSYTSTGNAILDLNKNITLTAGWDPAYTAQTSYSTFDGEKARRVMSVPAGAVVKVDHVIIQNGYNPVNNNMAGGIHNEGSLTMDDSIITGNNSFAEIGGLSNFGGQVTLNRTVVTHNHGGLINQISYTSNGVLTLNTTTIAYNTGYYGGVYNGPWNGSSVYINNSAIFENSSMFFAGGVSNKSLLLVINSSTIAHNYSEYGSSGLDGPVTLQNSLVSDGCSGTIVSQGYNLVQDTARCNLTPGLGDIVNVDPHFMRLDMTVALTKNSPAINQGNPAGCKDSAGNLIMIDQRGAPRIGRCDIGAYEYTLPGLPAKIYAYQGTPQRTPILNTFDQPLRALIVDNISSLIDNYPITFSAPPSGASGTFTDTGTFTMTSLTDEYGVATTSLFKANARPGSYRVTATVSDVITPANFLLANLIQVYFPVLTRNY